MLRDYQSLVELCQIGKGSFTLGKVSQVPAFPLYGSIGLLFQVRGLDCIRLPPAAWKFNDASVSVW